MSDADSWSRTLAPSPVCSLALAVLVLVTYIAAVASLTTYAFGVVAGVAVVGALVGTVVGAYRWSQ